MKKNNMRIKDITFLDQVSAIETIVGGCFTNGKYTPYFKEPSMIFAIVENFIEGVLFDEYDDVYECTKTDKELHSLVDKFLTPHVVGKDENGEDVILEYNEHYETMSYVNKMADEMIGFEKEKLIHHSEDLEKIVEFCEVMIDAFSNFANMTINKLTPEQLQDATAIMSKIADSNMTQEDLINIFKQSSNFDMDKASEEIIMSKNEQIAEKDKRIKKLVQDITKLKKENSKNVLADK